jgi:hypothetical protein
VLLVTDGRGTGNRLGAEEASARAVLAGVTVNVLGADFDMTIRQDATTGVRVRPGIALQFIANTTGGLYLQDNAAAPTPGPLLERLLADLHGRYTIGFTAPVPDGKPHQVNISVKSTGLTPRARRSYLAPNQP